MDSAEPGMIKDEEELRLEKLVFGDKEGFEANLRKIENLYESSDEEDIIAAESDDEKSQDDEEEEGDDMFFLDEGGDEDNVHEAEPIEDEMEVDDEDAAWHDSDDEKSTVSIIGTRSKKLRKSYEESQLSGNAYVARLRSQFEKIYPRPSWVDTFGEEKEDDEDAESHDDVDVGQNSKALQELLNSTNNYIKSKRALLPPTRISISRLKDANIQRRARGAISCISFHPSHPLLLTGGMDKTLRIYYIDGKSNQLVSSIFFPDVPIRTCLFSPDPSQTMVYSSGRRRYMNKWNLTTEEVEQFTKMYGQQDFQRSWEYFKLSPSGTYIALLGSSGYVHLLNSTTGHLVKALKVDGYLKDFVFTKDERTLIAANFGGDIWEFSLESQETSVKRRWTDVGAVNLTQLALGGPDDRWLAVGSKSGVVNIFDRHSAEATKSNPSPFKSVGNLVTMISHMAFSPDGQIFCISSKQKKDALRLVHLPSGTVFANWPTSSTPLGRVTCTQFSPNNQMLAVANDQGRITLWRLNHY